MPAEDKSLYIYGLHQFWVTLLNLATAIAIGLLTGMLCEGILFLAVYIPLRKFAGGYHAKTELRCYVISTILLCTALFSIYSIEHIRIIIAALPLIFFAASIVIVFFAPVDNPNKPLDSTEYAVYRKQSRIILILHWGIFFVSLINGKAEVATVVTVADLVLSGMIVLGFLGNRAEACNE